MSNIINKTKELIAYYLKANYEIKEINILQQEIETILGESLELKSGPVVGYDTLQEALGSLNEKEYFRKSKGVYYTPQDVVNFIINNSIRLYDYRLISKEKCVLSAKETKVKNLSSKTVLDPTCGSGEILVAFITKKIV